MITASALALALVASPLTVSRAEQASRVGAPTWGTCISFDDNTVTYDFPVSDTDSTSAYFGWGSIIVVTSSAAATCCLGMAATADLSIGVQSAATQRTVTDANGIDGSGPCFSVPALGRRNVMPLREALIRRPGGRIGVCTGQAVDIGGGAVLPACRVDGDCPSGTCDTTPSQSAIRRSGAILYCKSVISFPSLICASLER